MTTPSLASTDRASSRTVSRLRRGPSFVARFLAKLAVVALVGGAVLFMNPGVASADKADKSGCSAKQWHNSWQKCVSKLPKAKGETCKEPPVPSSPDSGMAGWFAEPDLPKDSDVRGQYTKYGYAGYDLNLYGVECDGPIPSGAETGNDLANLEFTLSTGIIGASNGLRQAAWNPDGMWGWADNFVEKASSAIYEKVFSVFGVITVGIVGVYLLWRSRQADMSSAITTAAWAVLVLVVVTAVASYPTKAANYADDALTGSLDVVQDAVGPPKANCGSGCDDTRPPALRASDMATDEIVYKNWVRSVFGQEENAKEGNSAYKFGPALYDAQALSWKQAQSLRKADPEDREKLRKEMVDKKKDQWRKITKVLEKEDPEVYHNVSGADGWDRVGSGFLALISALFFALFDITTSVLILLGFLLIRWGVVALPLIGTVAILKPASSGFKRLISIVVAALINVIVFGVASAVYLYAVSQILAAGMAGWLQVLLIGLIGVAAWMLLRPYRRLGSLRGGSTLADTAFARRRERAEIEQTHTLRRKEERADASGDMVVDTASVTRVETTAAASSDSSGNPSANVDHSEISAERSLPPRPAPGQAPPEMSSSRGAVRSAPKVYRPEVDRHSERKLAAVRPD